MLSWGRGDGHTGPVGVRGTRFHWEGLKTKSEKCRKQKGAWAITGLGRVLINESWVSGGAPMSAFGGRADVNHCVGECPLIARSGHWDEGWKAEIFRNLGVRKTSWKMLFGGSGEPPFSNQRWGYRKQFFSVPPSLRWDEGTVLSE